MDDHPEGVREAPEAQARHFNPNSTLPERARQAWQILVGMAMNRQTVTYARLSELMYGKPRPNILADILGHIASYCRVHDLPALTVIVVSKEGGRPREDALAGPGGVDAERERVYRHDWYDTVPPDAAALKAAFAGPGPAGEQHASPEPKVPDAESRVGLVAYLRTLPGGGFERNRASSRDVEL